MSLWDKTHPTLPVARTIASITISARVKSLLGQPPLPPLKNAGYNYVCTHAWKYVESIDQYNNL